MNPASLTIGHLARAAGVNVETVRYYQRVGLIQEPPRPLEGYRRYPAEVVDRIRFIKRSQKLGFSLGEIGELLALGEGHCAEVRQRAEEKRALIDAQIRDLKALRGTLDRLIKECGTGGRESARCPIVQTLSKKEP